MKEVKTKVWLVRANEHGTKADKTLIDEYSSGDKAKATPSGYLRYIGIAYEHSEPNSFEMPGNIPINPIGYALYSPIEVSHLEGELLTLADATFSEKEQREAFKSLLRTTLWKYNRSLERTVAGTVALAKERQ